MLRPVLILRSHVASVHCNLQDELQQALARCDAMQRAARQQEAEHAAGLHSAEETRSNSYLVAKHIAANLQELRRMVMLRLTTTPYCAES